MTVSIFVFQICMSIKNHQTALSFEKPHYLSNAILRRDFNEHMYMIGTRFRFYYVYTFLFT